MKSYCMHHRYLLLFFILIISNLGSATACRTQMDEANIETEVAIAPTPSHEQQTDSASNLAIVPASNAVLLCEDATGTHTWHYDANRQKWDQRSAELINAPGFIPQGLIPLRNVAGLLIYGVNVEQESNNRFQVYTWQDGTELQVVDEDQIYEIVSQLTRRLSPTRYLYATQIDNPTLLFQLDVGQCESGTCAFEPVTHLAITSPQDDKVLVWDVENWSIELTGAAKQPRDVIDIGWAPFWLDENTFGYLRSTVAQPNLGDAQSSLLIREIEESEVRMLLEPDRVKEFLIEQGAVDPTANVVLLNAMGTAAHADTTLVSVVDLNAPEKIFLLTVKPQIGQVQYVPEITSASVSELELTPGGHFLVAPEAKDLKLYNLATGEISRYPMENVSPELKGYAFTQRDDWLLLPAGSTSYFVNLRDGSIQEINLSDQYCTIGAWLESEN